MKSTGVVRRVDDLGRIVIPKKFAVLLELEMESHWKFL